MGVGHPFALEAQARRKLPQVESRGPRGRTERSVCAPTHPLRRGAIQSAENLPHPVRSGGMERAVAPGRTWPRGSASLGFPGSALSKGSVQFCTEPIHLWS